MAGPAPAPPSGARVWLLAARVPTLSAAVVPVLVGTAAVHRHFKAAPFVVALIASLLIQLGTNLANDYFDFQKGADTADRLGPPRVVQSGLLSPSTVRAATIVAFGLAALLGLYLVTVGGLPILLIGIASIAAGVLYTGGPWPLGYHGLGDLCTFVFFGLLAVLGTAYLYTKSVSGAVLVDALPVGFLVTAILVVNNLRDVGTDRLTGKNTLAVLIGPQATRAEFVLLAAAAYVVPVARVIAGASPWLLLPLLTLPFAAQQVRIVITGQGRALNAALKGTARLHLLFGVLFAVGLLA